MSPTPAHPRYEHPLRLVDGFDPALLLQATPPVEGVRSWRWLADPATTDEALSTYLSQHVRGHGTVDPTDPDLELQARSRTQVIAGYLAQHLFLDLLGDPPVRLRLTAGTHPSASDTHDAGPLPAGAGFPFTAPVAIIGTTVPARAAAAATGMSISAELVDFLAGRGIETWTGIAVDRRREWIDPVVVAPATELGQVTTAAEVIWQPFLSVWRPDPSHRWGVVDVVELGGPWRDAVVASAPAHLHRVEVRACPLIPDAGCGDLCTMHGGPWVSRSITAATRWEARRARMIRALGCDTCGDGAIKLFAGQVLGGKRQGIPIRPDTSTPTRHDRLHAVSDDTSGTPPARA
jgi:hypothetical protein